LGVSGQLGYAPFPDQYGAQYLSAMHDATAT
jgi:hypothetical protein